jgi:uncharacterized membrane protein HdeD (DUF308 family)
MSAMPAPTLTPPTLLHTLSRYWWLVLLRGIAFIVFGVLAFMWPGLTLVTLVLFYGAFALVDGVLALAHAIMGGGEMGSRWWLALVGVAGIAVGILTFMWPGLTALLLLVFIACWAIVLGVFQIAGAIKLRKEIDNEWTADLKRRAVGAVRRGAAAGAGPGRGRPDLGDRRVCGGVRGVAGDAVVQAEEASGGIGVRNLAASVPTGECSSMAGTPHCARPTQTRISTR